MLVGACEALAQIHLRLVAELGVDLAQIGTAPVRIIGEVQGIGTALVLDLERLDIFTFQILDIPMA